MALGKDLKDGDLRLEGSRREEASGEAAGGEEEKRGPGLQNGPSQPGPGEGGQGLCALNVQEHSILSYSSMIVYCSISSFLC